MGYRLNRKVPCPEFRNDEFKLAGELNRVCSPSLSWCPPN